jgi:hypothetical protein
MPGWLERIVDGWLLIGSEALSFFYAKHKGSERYTHSFMIAA